MRYFIYFSAYLFCISCSSNRFCYSTNKAIAYSQKNPKHTTHCSNILLVGKVGIQEKIAHFKNVKIGESILCVRIKNTSTDTLYCSDFVGNGGYIAPLTKDAIIIPPYENTSIFYMVSIVKKYQMIATNFRFNIQHTRGGKIENCNVTAVLESN